MCILCIYIVIRISSIERRLARKAAVGAFFFKRDYYRTSIAVHTSAYIMRIQSHTHEKKSIYENSRAISHRRRILYTHAMVVRFFFLFISVFWLDWFSHLYNTPIKHAAQQRSACHVIWYIYRKFINLLWSFEMRAAIYRARASRVNCAQIVRRQLFPAYIIPSYYKLYRAQFQLWLILSKNTAAVYSGIVYFRVQYVRLDRDPRLCYVYI